jgi:hypothetical protein
MFCNFVDFNQILYMFLSPKGMTLIVLFAWLISRTFSANEQCFSLTINQRTVLSAKRTWLAHFTARDIHKKSFTIRCLNNICRPFKLNLIRYSLHLEKNNYSIVLN